jgi:hypothetical protein|mmetsp:Transcript_27730/g.62846  ORF Transcript_27730/g.62846 Transcript_27730/m.62846 type:complete len:96 (+) Transcript_27730:261-548(+)
MCPKFIGLHALASSQFRTQKFAIDALVSRPDLLLTPGRVGPGEREVERESVRAREREGEREREGSEVGERETERVRRDRGRVWREGREGESERER